MTRVPILPSIPPVAGATVVIVLLLAIAGLVAGVSVWWRVFAKAGFSGALGLLMLVPGANGIMLLVLAFSRWPIEEEIDRLRGRLGQDSRSG